MKILSFLRPSEINFVFPVAIMISGRAKYLIFLIFTGNADRISRTDGRKSMDGLIVLMILLEEYLTNKEISIIPTGRQ